jgi:hypothetical protein
MPNPQNTIQVTARRGAGATHLDTYERSLGQLPDRSATRWHDLRDDPNLGHAEREPVDRPFFPCLKGPEGR